MKPDSSARVFRILGWGMIFTSLTPLLAQDARPKKIYMITDMEGVDGIFNWENQCDPFKSPR